ncbi:uncharacterized protein LOC133908443 [Phragmites australis]|uniref:uncharacterized protein LOC133908443 n=1 Tax=Phragmites australis TaxID=29695 RepID=UPI002D76940D|nr:uncharacterized protein LOC133908443 [Phragmites australis]
MPPSKPKRRRGGAGSRGRKKQKRLDAIHDVAPAPPPPSPGAGAGDDDSDAEAIRRSTRVRRAPVVLDTSPLPSPRRKRPRRGGGGVGSSGSSRRGTKSRTRDEADAWEMEEEDDEGSVVWRSRLRDRVKGKANLERRARTLWFGEDDDEEEDEEARMVVVDVREGAEDEEVGEEGGGLQSQRRELRDREINLTIDLNVEAHEAVVGVNVVEEEEGEKEQKSEVVAVAEEEEPTVGTRNDVEEGKEEEVVAEEGLQREERTEELELPVLGGHDGDELACDEGNEEVGASNSDRIERLDVQSEEIAEESNLRVEQQMDLDCPGPPEQEEEVQQGEHMDHVPNIVLSEDGPKERMPKSPVSDEKRGVKLVKEGRRCGLCGGGTDGRPPKIALHDCVDSDNEAYEGVLPSEEPNYDIWDGFGDDPGWLGRLLGPIHDRFGIARVWVHQNCAVWSPEVYFAGLGCLRNVRAALCRGRLLKCSRCGRPGATIGCRVDRCPKTYHLPCSRAEACIFDHRKFLIACNDHRHLFQPQGDKYVELLRKMKIKKMKADIRKLSHDAWRKDKDAEEKWLENCGEDEEFLKREGKRLNRDLLRIAPVYIGGSSENEKSYCGWESVAGLSDVIQSMKEVVILPLLYPEFFSSLGLTPPRGVLLHGHPGTGKTLVVRALIGACSQGNRRIAYFARKGADCLGKYVGDAERQLRLLFQVAERCQPSIIFFDEIDGLAPCRSRQQDQTHNSVVATLLSLLDGLKSRGSVIVIGATNRPDAIDPALRRPGRFDREIYFPLPTFEDRSAILSLHTKNWPSPISGAFLSHIASQTVGYAGADLQAICTQAAINALKRTCPLQEILRSAEKGIEHGRVPLPSVLVEERDWLAAVAAAPPPCSQREAGNAANDLVSSPLDSYLVPSLLKPLVHLLISLYLDERVWLPSSLLKASGSIKEVVFSSMEKHSVPCTFWSSYLHSLIQQKDIAHRIGTILSSCGLVAAQLGNHGSMLPSHVETQENFDGSRLNSMGFHLKAGLPHKLSGFRALVAGAPGSGQQHLIRCLLHGFTGQIVIHKLDIATMAQEGNGDILSGLTQILLKCLNLGRCIIYMPRIDLWAVEKVHNQIEGHMLNMGASDLASSPTNHVEKCSEVWNALVEQMDSLLASVSISILSTSDLRFQDLPSGVRGFFSAHVVDQFLASSEHTIPRFSVNIDNSFNWDEMIDSCALRLSHDLIQHHVQFLHGRSHKNNHDEQKEVFASMEISAPGESKSSENEQPSFGVASRENPTQLAASSAQQEPPPSNVKDKGGNIQKTEFEGTVRRNPSSRTVKGNESLAIIAFGIQILQHPHFSKLCWVTSKLREGPCTDINGPWKGWPFNSCLLHSSTLPDKSLNGGNNVVKGKEKTLCARGLVAVGLLAYRGVYASVMEVCAEVRKVLELLVGQIRTKILEKRNRFRYFHILSHVAYLDDIVNSWAYTFHRLHIESRTGTSGTKLTSQGRSCTKECQSTRYAAETNLQVAPAGNPTEVQDIPAQRTQDHEVFPACCPNEMQDNSVQHTSDQLEIHTMVCDLDDDHVTSISSRDEVECNIVHSASPDVHRGNHTHADSITNDGEPSGANNDGKMSGSTYDEENCRSDTQRSENHTESVEHLNDLQRAGNSVASSASTNSTGIPRNIVSSEAHGDDNELKTNNPLSDVESGHLIDGQLQDNMQNLSVPKSSCLYKCCSTCFRAVYKMVHDILSNPLRPNLHCLTVDDMHDILSSWSLNLLATVRKCYSSQDVVSCEENFGKMHKQGHCACQSDVTLLSRECICHLESNEDAETANADCHSLFGQRLSFFFKDGVWMPSEFTAETTLHCSFRRLCVCSILGTVSMFSQIST